MKIKLSKSQWEEAGIKAGWLKTAQTAESPLIGKEVCKQCHGNKFINEKLRNLGTSESVDHMSFCPTCNGKGFTTQEDRKKAQDSYLHSMGVAPCPHGNDCSCDKKGNI